MTAKPLLSICIPAYNGGAYLRAVLSLLLHQAAEFSDCLEVIVADDGSTDDTASICREFSGSGYRLITNSPNLGMGPNIAACIAKHAQGEFVWIWSQHCLLRPGALSRVVKTLREHHNIDAFYVNFRCARFPDRWPGMVDNTGFDGAFDYISNPNVEQRRLDAWHELLLPATCLCTQTYAHIVRRRLEKDYLDQQSVQRDFGPAIATFTQTTTTAETCFNRPAVYIGDPVFTIFNGAQTWSRIDTRALVYFQALPELVGIYQRHGLSELRLQQAERYASAMAAACLNDLLNRAGSKHPRLVCRYLWRFHRQHGCVPLMLGSFFGSDWCAAVRCLRALQQTLHRIAVYSFYRCRPARWYHRRRQRTAVAGKIVR